MDGRPTTLRESVRRFWTSYWPAWLFPVVFYISIFFMPLGDQTNWVWFGFDIPFFFIASFWAQGPYRRRQERYSHAVILGMLVPFLIWGVMVFGPFLLLKGLSLLVGASGTP